MAVSKPWLTDEPAQSDQKHAPATLRNRDAIVAVLKEHLPETGTILEVASGTGEHAVFFGENFPDLVFQPSDPDSECCRSITSWVQRAEATNVLAPLEIDALADSWSIEKADAILCINMIHIAPWEASVGLFQKSAALLETGALFYLYGPFFRDGVETAQGNLDFERSLKSRNLQWGIRDVVDVDALAADNGFVREQLIEMPANNLSLIYRKA